RHQLGRQRGLARVVSFRRAIIEPDVSSFDPAELAQARFEALDRVRSLWGEHTDPVDLFRRLRQRRRASAEQEGAEGEQRKQQKIATLHPMNLAGASAFAIMASRSTDMISSNMRGGSRMSPVAQAPATVRSSTLRVGASAPALNSRSS